MKPTFYDWMMGLFQLMQKLEQATDLNDDEKADAVAGDVWDYLCERKSPFDWLFLCYLLLGGVEANDGTGMLMEQGRDAINGAAEQAQAAFLASAVSPKNDGPKSPGDFGKLWQP